jgi:hypothetical protein
MPWEDPDDVRNKINRYITQQGDETEAESDALSIAVREYVKYDRAENANVAACTQVYNNVMNSYDDQLSLRCADLVAKLPVMPVTAIIGLRSFSTGVCWLLGQVELLEQHLESRTTLEPHQRLLAIALCGRNRRDLFTDPLVKQWNLDYLSGLKGPGVLSAAQVVELFLPTTGRPGCRITNSSGCWADGSRSWRASSRAGRCCGRTWPRSGPTS